MKLGMTIAGLAEAVGGRLLKGDPLSPFDAFVTDTRRLLPADFFWALKGVSYDAHDFLASALARRPSGWLVREDAGANGAPPVVITVPDTLRALQSLAARHRRRFALPLVAISGSNGKTTTKEMLRAVFAEAGETCASPASFNNHFGLPLSLLELTERHKYAVFELGASRRGEIRELCSVAAPGIGVLTNIGPEHLEYFGDMETVFKAETELAECLSADGTLVYNCDDPFLSRLGGPGQRTLTFGGSDRADVRILPGEKLFLEHRGAREEIKLPVPCAHNFYNAAGAAAAALAAGLDLALIKRGLERYTPPAMRMQELRFGGAAVILDAYNANPASMAAALAEMRRRPEPRYFLLGDMKELGRHSARYHAELGTALAGAGAAGVFLAGPEMKPAAEAYHAAGGRGLVYGSTLEGWAAEARRLIRQGAGTFLIKASRSMRFELIVDGL